jgi:hypothetical protein
MTAGLGKIRLSPSPSYTSWSLCQMAITQTWHSEADGVLILIIIAIYVHAIIHINDDIVPTVYRVSMTGMHHP